MANSDDTRKQHLANLAKMGVEAPELVGQSRGIFNALTNERADALCIAIAEYPNFRTACAACSVSHSTVMSWLRRGTLPGAPPLMSEFAERFLRADAEHARTCYTTFKLLAENGSGTANAILKYMTSRWKVNEQEDLVGLVEAGKKKTDNLEALLISPTPRLQHLLKATGWVRHPAWGTETWGQVINTTGVASAETE